MNLSLLALLTGFAADLLFGDPRWLYHPVRLVGKIISVLEQNLRKIFRIPAGEGRSPKREFAAGTLLAVLVILLSAGIPLILLVLAQWVSPLLRFGLESIWCWQLLAVRSLRDESMKVYERLREDDLEGSRKAVSMIVGRDTQRLDETGVAKAAVETVAENASDGVVAPLFYMLVGGAVLGFFYKAINTMDSMIGYKNDRYLYFGRFAAKLDDAVNFIPSRLCALFMVCAAFLCRFDGKQAWKIFKRDRFNHASPNSAQTESVMAGALRVQLAGDAWYFGKLCKKKTIGDDLRPVEAEDIIRANELLYAAAAVAVTVLSAVKWILLWFI